VSENRIIVRTTLEEEKAIKAMRRLAKNWPESLRINCDGMNNLMCITKLTPANGYRTPEGGDIEFDRFPEQGGAE
jgi:hypothetical protein